MLFSYRYTTLYCTANTWKLAAMGPPWWKPVAESTGFHLLWNMCRKALKGWLFQMHGFSFSSLLKSENCSSLFISVAVKNLPEPTPKELHDEEYGEWLTKEEKFHLDNAKAELVLKGDWIVCSAGLLIGLMKWIMHCSLFLDLLSYCNNLNHGILGCSM